MNVKEQLHRLVDALTEDDAERLLEELREEPLSAEDVAAVRRGIQDFQTGRVLTEDEVRRKYGL